MNLNNNQHEKLDLRESVFLLCLLIEAGITLEASIIALDKSFSSTPLNKVARKIKKSLTPLDSQKLGQYFLLAAQSGKSSEESAFFSLLATGIFSGMSICDKMRWMAEVFQKSKPLNNQDMLIRKNYLLQSAKSLATQTGLDFVSWENYLNIAIEVQK